MRQFTHWRWHLGEVYVRIDGEMRHLWRAVDHEGEVLESFVTNERDKAAALKFIRMLPKWHGSPQAVVTDGLCSYSTALSEIGAADRQQTGRWLNSRAENSHHSFGRRERTMARFRRMKRLQTFTCPCRTAHPLQPGTSPSQPRYLQAETLRRPSRMAIGAGINSAGSTVHAPEKRAVHFGLLAPWRTHGGN